VCVSKLFIALCVRISLSLSLSCTTTTRLQVFEIPEEMKTENDEIVRRGEWRDVMPLYAPLRLKGMCYRIACLCVYIYIYVCVITSNLHTHPHTHTHTHTYINDAVRYTPRTHTGDVMVHCHVQEHSDTGMMAIVRVKTCADGESGELGISASLGRMSDVWSVCGVAAGLLCAVVTMMM
jgi:hypothetical protein